MSVIIFSSEKALRQLLYHGKVVTLRKERREGAGWVTDRRGGRKIADVTIEKIGKLFFEGGQPYIEITKTPALLGWIFDEFERGDRPHLDYFVPMSGFDSSEEWLEELKKQHRGKIPEDLYLYEVEINTPICPRCGRFMKSAGAIKAPHLVAVFACGKCGFVKKKD